MLIRLTDTDLHKIVCRSLNVPQESDVEVMCELKGFLHPVKLVMSQSSQYIELPEKYSILING